MDLINSFFHFFTDRSRHIGTKATLILSLVLMLVLADNLFSFSYYYNNSQKISQAKQITEILKEPGLSGYEKEKLQKLRRNIIDHSNWKDYAYSFFTNISFTNSKKTMAAKPNTAKPIPERSYTWHFVTSAWPLIMLILWLPIGLLFDKNVTLGVGLFVIIIFGPLLFGFAWLLAKAFSYIPVILGNPIYNYILNASLCTLIFLAIGFLSKWYGKQS